MPDIMKGMTFVLFLWTTFAKEFFLLFLQIFYQINFSEGNVEHEFIMLYTTCLTVLGYWRKTISSAVSLILQAMRA
jgi:hypothetical protein